MHSQVVLQANAMNVCVPPEPPSAAQLAPGSAGGDALSIPCSYMTNSIISMQQHARLRVFDTDRPTEPTVDDPSTDI